MLRVIVTAEDSWNWVWGYSLNNPKNLISLLLFFFSLVSLGARSTCVIPIVSANSENFFDYVRDGNVADWGYRDRLAEEKGREGDSWTEEVFDQKLSNFQVFLKQVGLPPIFATAEFENANVALKVAREGDYNHLAMTQGDDPRGINNLVLTRDIKPVSITRHRLEGRNFAGHPTRQILEVQYRIADKYDFILFVNHWPSQMGPTEARFDAAEHLRSIINQRQERMPNVYIMAVGDFNTVDNEKDMSKHPFNESLLKPELSGHLIDLQDYIVGKNPRRKFPPGTFHYIPRKKEAPWEWNRFDRFLVSENLLGKSGLRVDPKSYEILMPKISTKTITDPATGKEIQVPFGFDPKTGKGMTDHFPIRVNLVY